MARLFGGGWTNFADAEPDSRHDGVVCWPLLVAWFLCSRVSAVRPSRVMGRWDIRGYSNRRLMADVGQSDCQRPLRHRNVRS
jgi:hypothetical protein